MKARFYVDPHDVILGGMRFGADPPSGWREFELMTDPPTPTLTIPVVSRGTISQIVLHRVAVEHGVAVYI